MSRTLLTSSVTDEEAALFREAMRQLVGGVCVITVGSGSERRGFTATAVMSLSDRPPTLALGINKNTSVYPPLVRTKRFGVNVLSHGQRKLADIFAGRCGVDGAARFIFAEWATSGDNPPALKNALAYFDCVCTAHIDVSTHSLIVGEAKHITVPSSGSPLIYWDRHYECLPAANND